MTCAYLADLRPIEPSTTRGCEDCLATGDSWVHLRLCMSCGHVGCCDSSTNHHATAQATTTSHPVIQSFERAEDWAYCYPDDDLVEHLAPHLHRSVQS